MLSPEFLDSLPENVVKLFAQVEQDILMDMARRISKMDTITDTAAWQAWRYEQTKLVSSNALKVLANATGKSKTELMELFQAAALETLQSDGKIYSAAGLAVPESLSPTLKNILQSGYLQTGQAMNNFTATTANTVTREFENALDRAWLQVNTGAFSYQQSIRQAVLNLAKDGLHSVIYPSGHKDTMEVAVRRAVLTGINQTAAKLQIARMDEMQCDLVETTAHAGARPSHAAWQGRIFNRSGTSRKYPDFATSTGYGTGAGLCGWNCRHNFYPYFEGLSKRAYTGQQLKDFEKKEISYKGKDYTRYEASQIQRELERRIRKSKREYLALDAAGQDTTQTAAILSKRRQALKDFLNETGLRQDSFREQVAGFGRSAAAKASWNARMQPQFKNKDIPSILHRPEYIDMSLKQKQNIESELDILPAHIRNLAESKITKIHSTGNAGWSGYNLRTGEVFLSDEREFGSVIHEYGHAVETALNLYQDPHFLAILHSGLENIKIDDIIIDDETFTESIFRVKCNKLISLYQGRLYENFGENGIYDGTKVYLDGMREYFSEGFRCYYLDSELLHQKDPLLYNFIKELNDGQI